MKDNKFGLPFEYQTRPEFFDDFAVNKNGSEINAIISNILKNYFVKTVLDMACGSGSQVFDLIKNGFELTGSDFSPVPLQQAREKAAREKLEINFVDGDMRFLQLGMFDAVITIANAIGHLTKLEFEVALKNIYKNLKPGGIYVFDIFNLEAMTDEVVMNFAFHTQKKINDLWVHCIQCSTINYDLGILTSYDNLVTQKINQPPEYFASQFSLQIYTASELHQTLLRNGFEVLIQYDMNGNVFDKKLSQSILTVARKV